MSLIGSFLRGRWGGRCMCEFARCVRALRHGVSNGVNYFTLLVSTFNADSLANHERSYSRQDLYHDHFYYKKIWRQFHYAQNTSYLCKRCVLHAIYKCVLPIRARYAPLPGPLMHTTPALVYKYFHIKTSLYVFGTLCTQLIYSEYFIIRA